MMNETKLCIGPMSKNCVDAAIEYAYEYNKEVMLIASRRQVDCEELGGGYVNNWNTVTYAEYVKNRDPEGRIVLARDHGGPWQSNVELQNCATIEEALESSKLSLKTDIEAGFRILHLDPVVSKDGGIVESQIVLERLFELYIFCMETANALGKSISIEVGTEEQQEKPLDDPKNLDNLLGTIQTFCKNRKYKMPEYVVVQTGTKVMEMSNVGDFPRSERDILAYTQSYKFKQLKEITDRYCVKIKQHNTDYLPAQSLRLLSRIGIDAVNVAPEFGVVETNELMNLLAEYNMQYELSLLQKLCVDSGAWKKWMLKDSVATVREKTQICGHYNYTNNNFALIKKSLQNKMKIDGRSLDVELRNSIKDCILRYTQNLAG